MVARVTPIVRSALLVEDDPPLRALVVSYLKLLNFTVSEAADGAKAMIALAEQTYDLVCLDLMLPESSGYDVLEFLRKEGIGKTPVLMMSARSLPEDRAQAEELGATLYLIKPFTRSDFTRAVKAALETRK